MSVDKDVLCETRLVNKLYNTNIRYYHGYNHFLFLSSTIRDNLVHFYLKNYISSSLDLHFILMSLGKIQDFRSSYIENFKKGKKPDSSIDILKIHSETVELDNTIGIWQNDDKWLKNKPINLKRKKLFEVKWMRKNLQQNKIIKKRAGLKKLHKLEQKKYLKKFH